MKVLILAAGYATRLYPLTLTQPKPLLPVASKPMIDYVLDNLAPIPGINHVYVATNQKFAAHFQRWADAYRQTKTRFDFTIVNDHSTHESNRLGAIGDLNLVLESQAVDDDLVVVAGDNLFSRTLESFGEFCRHKQAPVIGVYDVGSLEQAKKYSTVEADPQGRIVAFTEKPTHPATTLIGIALYYYPRTTLPWIRRYLAEGNNPDQPGRLVQWMAPQLPFFTWTVPGLWFDVGSKETLEEAGRIFSRL